MNHNATARLAIEMRCQIFGIPSRVGNCALGICILDQRRAMMPRTLYVLRWPNGVLEGRERLSDFENLKDQEIAVYELKERERLTISGKAEASDVSNVR